MKLLPNEHLLLSSNEDKIVLTNLRVMMSDKVWGKSFKISICLEDISAIEFHYKSNIIFLIFGIILAIGGVISSSFIGINYMVSNIAIIVGLILIIAWWFTKKHLVTIFSKGGSHLNFLAEKMTDETINSFITDVQEAKINRVNKLHNL